MGDKLGHANNPNAFCLLCMEHPCTLIATGQTESEYERLKQQKDALLAKHNELVHKPCREQIDRLKSALAEVAEAVKADIASALAEHPTRNHVFGHDCLFTDAAVRVALNLDTEKVVARLVGQTTGRQEALADLRERCAAYCDAIVQSYAHVRGFELADTEPGIAYELGRRDQAEAIAKALRKVELEPAREEASKSDGEKNDNAISR